MLESHLRGFDAGLELYSKNVLWPCVQVVNVDRYRERGAAFPAMDPCREFVFCVAILTSVQYHFGKRVLHSVGSLSLAGLPLAPLSLRRAE